MSFSEGQLSVTLVIDDRQVLEVRVRSTRPPKLEALLGRRTRAELGQLVPSLFSVCRVGQQACALSALRLEVPAPGLGLTLEALEHHAWHFDVEWPRALGLPPFHEALRATFQALRGGAPKDGLAPFRSRLQAIVDGGEVLQATDRAFLARCRVLDEGVEWGTPRTGAPTLAECEAGLARGLEFAARPCLAARGANTVHPQRSRGASENSVLNSGESGCGVNAGPSTPLGVNGGAGRDSGPIEVGPLARVFTRPQVQAWAKTRGWGLETRARARALDALEALERLETQTLLDPEVLHVNSTVSAALVEVARGPLVHRIECVEDRPVAWSSVAPTEWTFHPDGALQALKGSLAPSVQDRARVFVTLLDPCVACSIEVVRA